MARIHCIAATAEVALAAATAKTVIKVTAPTNQRVVIEGWGVGFDGIAVTEAPVVCRLVKLTTAGTFSSLTPVRTQQGGSETVQSTAGHTATAEPTKTDVYDIQNVHPQTAMEWYFPLSQEIILAGGGSIGIECTAPAVVNVIAKIRFEE